MFKNELKNDGIRIRNGAGHVVSFEINGKMRKMHFSDVELTLPEEDIEALYNTKGGRVLIEEGILIILDSDFREKLNLEPLDEYTLNSEGFEKMFESKDYNRLKDFLTYCSEAMAERAVDEAIRLGISDIQTALLLEKATKKNIRPLVEEKLEKGLKKENKKETESKKTGKKKTAKRKMD